MRLILQSNFTKAFTNCFRQNMKRLKFNRFNSSSKILLCNRLKRNSFRRTSPVSNLKKENNKNQFEFIIKFRTHRRIFVIRCTHGVVTFAYAIRRTIFFPRLNSCL